MSQTPVEQTNKSYVPPKIEDLGEVTNRVKGISGTSADANLTPQSGTGPVDPIGSSGVTGSDPFP